MCETEPSKPKRCGKYWFKLAGKPKTYFKETILIDFTPLSKTKKIQKRLILPTYNNDRKHFTPAFTLPSVPLENEALLREQHEQRVKENTTEISQILVAKPRSRQKYCGVCRDSYEEYLDHVISLKHIQKLRASKFQGYILETAQLFKQQKVSAQELSFQKHPSLDTNCQTPSCSLEQDLVEAYLNLA